MEIAYTLLNYHFCNDFLNENKKSWNSLKCQVTSQALHMSCSVKVCHLVISVVIWLFDMFLLSFFACNGLSILVPEQSKLSVTNKNKKNVVFKFAIIQFSHIFISVIVNVYWTKLKHKLKHITTNQMNPMSLLFVWGLLILTTKQQ